MTNRRGDLSPDPGLWAADESEEWWLFCEWQPGHRHRAEEVHPLLLRLLRKRGNGFMTTEHVLAVMDARDPEEVVSAWLKERRAVPLKHPCLWPGCRLETASVGPNARYCEAHAAISRRQTRRAYKRKAQDGEKTGVPEATS